jgi:pimeloyl-ACP methyl ester carboxylesterase
MQSNDADASTRRIAAENGIVYAYRDLGDGDVPLVLLQHFRGNLDNWDSALVDTLAANRRVVTFDNVGVGATTGKTPSAVEAMAHEAIAFLDAMDLQRVDLLGFSIGSFVAQEMALIRPDLVRRVVLASSAPQGAAGMHGWAPEVIAAVGAPETTPQGYLSVFFAPTDTSREAGQETAGRIFGGRLTDRDEPTTWQTRQAQYRRRLHVGHPEPRATRTSRRDRAPGVRRQRRQRPDDPAALLVPVGRAPSERAAHDLPGLGPRLSLPAPQPIRSRCARLPRGRRLRSQAGLPPRRR